MKFSLKTWYKNHGKEGVSTSYIKFQLQTPNADFRNRVSDAIRSALVDPEPGKDQKPTAMGFQHFED